MCPECRKWRFRFTKARLAAGLPEPAGGADSAAPDPLAGFTGERRDGEGRDRPAHFLVASAAYGPNLGFRGFRPSRIFKIR